MQASVVVPTYNRRDSLLVALDGLDRQTASPSEFEVIVVSDGSSDGTEEAVRQRASRYRLRMLEQPNSGPAAARNHGARAACTDIIVFMDDDIEPAPSFVEEHLRAHAADPDVVIIGPQSMPPGERFPVWIAWEHRMLERQYERFQSGEWLPGPNNLYSGNMSLRRGLLLDAGGFDVRYTRQEDVELGFRLAHRGATFRFVPQAIGYHRPSRTFRSWCNTPYQYGVRDVEMAREKGQQEALALARKHYRERNILTRALARAAIGRRVIEPAVLRALPATAIALDRVGLRQVSLAMLSVLFNLLYLQGMCRELGGAHRLWETLRGAPDSPSV